MAISADRVAERNPHFPHLPTPGEILKGIKNDVRGVGRWIGDRRLIVTSAVGIGSLGIAGAEAWNRFQSDQKPAQVQTADTPPPSAPVIIYDDGTATPEPSATPILDKLDAFIANATKEAEMVPFEVKTFPAGKEMMYVNESNYSTIFSIVTQEEAQKGKLVLYFSSFFF